LLEFRFYLNKENTLAEIVESSHLFRDFWISDKTRFSYEGLSHEFSVYIDLIGNSEKKELFQKLFSNISLTNFAVICGYNIDLETLQTIDPPERLALFPRFGARSRGRRRGDRPEAW